MEGTAAAAGRSRHAVRRGVAFLRAVAPLGLVALLTGATLALDFAAEAHVHPVDTYLMESTHTLTFTVENTGTTDSIGAVEIARPSRFWTILGCPVAPDGWSTVQSATWCRYRNPAGPDGDLLPGEMSSDFQVLIATEGGLRNVSGTWKVTVSKSDLFDKKSLLTTDATEPPGLTTTAYSFRILDAIVVETAPATAGAPCPTGAHEAVTGSHAIVVICGENRTNMTLTPSASQASLGGTFIGGATGFMSGPVGARSSESVVLGWWTDVHVTNLSGPAKTIVARVGASPNQTSPLTTLTGYEALNQPPVASATTATTNEDTTTGPITLEATDPDGDAMTFSIASGPANGVLSAISADPCPATSPGTPNTCTATVTYTPDADFNGADEFNYVATDTFGAPSAPATVSLTVTAVNDAPSFTSGGDVTVNEDSGPYSAAWATSISAGPANEAGQAVTFQVSNDNTALFVAQPAVSPGGFLSFTPAPDANGTAEVTVTAIDDGGTASGGDDTSDPVMFTLTVDPVNDAPSFTSGGDVTVLEDSGPYSAAWAMAISAGPPNEASQTVTFLVSNNNPGLFSAQPAVSPGGVLSFTPAPDANGSALVTVELSDDGGMALGGDDTSDPVMFTLTVDPVNDAPSFTSGGDVTVLEDSGPYSAAWATAISAGPPNEAGQLVTFSVTGNSNPGLFSAAPAVAPDGTLSFTPAPDANGSALVTVELSDDGGIDNGGVDTSPSQMFTLTVTAVNDAPSFTSGGDVGVLEDSGAYSAAWATGISPGGGPDEAGQNLSFDVTNDNNGLFAVQPAVAPDGTLSFTPAPDANGSALVTVELSDDGGIDNGGVDTSPSQMFTLTVTAVNDAPSFDLPADPDQIVIQDSGPQTVAGFATNISAGPPDESGQTVTFQVSNDNNVLFATQPDIDETSGDLTYTPASGATGSAIVTVVLSDDGGTDNGGDDTSAPVMFTITVNPPNATPVAAGVTETTNEDTPVTITLSASDADDDDLTFSIAPSMGPSIGTLGTISSPDCTTILNTCTATVEYTPSANLNGGDGFTFIANDGQADSNGATVTITVNAVNDAPSFTKGADESVLEDSGAHTVNSWATAISPGGGTDETTQVLAFVVTNNTNPGLFSAAPAVDSDGDLTYTLAADAFGTATISLKLTDNGGTANGGVDESAEQSFDIVVAGVNDAPSFTKGADQNVAEDAGPQSVAGWATGISAGPTNESGQTLTFVVTNNTNSSLFSADPAVSASGTLTFTTAANQHGMATITLKLTDDGGTANGGVDESAEQSFDITVSAVNDPPTSPGRAYGANSLQANMQRSIGAASGLLVGAADAADVAGNGSYVPTFTVGTVNGVTPVGGTITTTIAGTGTVVADATTGAFTINPAPGVTGDVSFNFTVCDSGDGSPASECSSAATASFNIASPVIWFVDDSVADGGSGRLTDPFDTLADAVAAIGSDQNERVFLYSGAYSTGINLNTGGWLVGQSVTDTSFDTVMGITPAADTILRPSIGTGPVTVGGTVGLATNAKVRGIAISSGTATGMGGAGGLTGVDVDQTSITTTTGTGLSLNNVGGTVNLSSLTVNGAANGVNLTNVAAAVAIAGGSITDTTGPDVAISGGSGNFTYNGTIADDVSTLVSISGATGGTKTFGGAITDGDDGDGSGIALTNNGGATVSFSGGVTLSTGPNPAFAATGGGTVNVTGSANTITTTTGTALHVANTTIGASGLTFRRISANGAANGIVLNATGSSGGLTVSGTGTAGSGGTIQNTTGDAISLTSTRNVSLSRMIVQNNLGSGINGSGVTNFSLTFGTVDNNGDDGAADEAGIRFTNLHGTASITDTTVANSIEDNVRIVNNTGTLTQLTVSNSTIRDTETVSPGNNGLLIQADGTASITADITGSSFLRNRANGIQVVTNDAGSMDVEIGTATAGSGGTFQDNNIGVNIAKNSSGTFSFDVLNGSFSAPTLTAAASQINLNLAGVATGTMQGTVAGNTITNNNSLIGPGMRIIGNGAATLTVKVENNSISQVANHGIHVLARDGSNTINATILNNTITLTNLASLDGIRVDSGATSTDTTTVCADITGNNATTIAGQFGIRVRQRFTLTTFTLEDYAGGSTDDTAVAAFLNGNNTSSPAPSADHGGAGFTTTANCPEPS